MQGALPVLGVGGSFQKALSLKIKLHVEVLVAHGVLHIIRVVGSTGKTYVAIETIYFFLSAGKAS